MCGARGGSAGRVGRRCCMKDLLRVGRFGPPFSSPQEPHCRDAVEGSIPRIRRSTRVANWPAYTPGPRSPRRCDGVVVLGSDRCLDAPPERAGGVGSGGTRILPSKPP